MQNLYWFLAAAAGAGLAAQAGVNASCAPPPAARSGPPSSRRPSRWPCSPPRSWCSATRLAATGYARYPWWIWTGGIAGATYVVAAVALTRSLGVAPCLRRSSSASSSAGLVIDHFGWFNVPVHRVSPERLVGAALLVGGMALIRWR